MKHFFEDLVHELRAKRLLPVAILLLVALVAVPVFLLNGGEDPKPSAATPPPSSQAKQLALLSKGENQSAGSGFDVFTKKDPFKPDMPRLGSVASMAQDAGLSAQPSSEGGGGQGASDAANGGGGQGEGQGGGSGDPGGSGGASQPRTRRASYAYVADVSFGREGSERRYRGLQRLEMLPNSDSPLLVFLGATRNGGDAVFLVDSSLRQAGEGSCADRACSVLSLGPGSEHRFRDDSGREYVLVIDRIRRVRAGASSAKASGASARAAGRGGRRRGLVSSLLVDTETATTAGASSPAGKGR
jgi:hypothetical protein